MEVGIIRLGRAAGKVSILFLLNINISTALFIPRVMLNKGDLSDKDLRFLSACDALGL
jgi:hypothetical protein